MKIPPLPQVECAILHEGFVPIDAHTLLGAIEAAARQHGLGETCQPMITSTEKDVHVLVGEHRVLVSQNAEPLVPDGFRTALTTPFTSMIFPNAREAVEGHRANTFVTVGKGPVSMPEEVYRSEIGEMVAAMSAYTTSEEALRSIAVCQQITQFVTRLHPASALHWCVSDNLMPQAFFDAAAASSDPTRLNIRPYLTSSAGRMGEGLPIGVTANGSQWLLGKMVAMDEAPVPLEWLLTTTYSFVSFCLMRGSLLPHMHTFSVEGEDWQVGVFHEKIDGFDGWEMVRLKVLHHPKYGIHGKAAAKRTFEYKSVEDVKRHAAEERTGSTARPQSVADLRALAQAGAASRQGPASAPVAVPGGFAGRVRSLLKGKLN
jgi:hypothetical protein